MLLWDYMSMERLAEILEQRGLEGDRTLAADLKQHAEETSDIPVEDFDNFSTPQRSVVPMAPERGLTLSVAGRAIRTTEFQFSEHTPELIQEFYSKLWEMAGEQIGHKIKVPKLRVKQAELDLAESNGLSYLYLPPRYANPDALPTLAEIFLFARGPYTYEDGPYHYVGRSINNTSQQEGWITVEQSSSTSLVNTDRE